MNHPVEVDAAPSQSIPAGVSPSSMSALSDYATTSFPDYSGGVPGPSPQIQYNIMPGEDGIAASGTLPSLRELVGELQYQPDRFHYDSFMLQLRRRTKFLLTTSQSPLTVEESEYAKLYLINPLHLNVVHFNTILTTEYNEQVFSELISFIHEISATIRELAPNIAAVYSNGSFNYTDESMIDSLIFLRLVVPRLYRLRALLTDPTQMEVNASE